MGAKKDETISYKKDKEALDWLKKILQSKEKSLSVRLHRELSKYLELTTITKQPLQFNKMEDLKEFLRAVASGLLRECGFSFKYEKVDSFESLLKIEKGKSGNVRSYTVVGFIDETYIKEKFGIDKII